MRARIGTVMKLLRGGVGMHYVPTPPEEIDICLNCPFPDCKKNKCDWLKTEKERLKREKKQRV